MRTSRPSLDDVYVRIDRLADELEALPSKDRRNAVKRLRKLERRFSDKDDDWGDDFMDFIFG